MPGLLFLRGRPAPLLGAESVFDLGFVFVFLFALDAFFFLSIRELFWDFSLVAIREL